MAQKVALPDATWAWTDKPGVITHPLMGLLGTLKILFNQTGVCGLLRMGLEFCGSFGPEPQLLWDVWLRRAKEQEEPHAPQLPPLKCSL